MPKMTGNRYFAEAMRGYGVSHLFYVNSIVGGAMKEMDKRRREARRHATARRRRRTWPTATRGPRTSPGICLCQDIGSTNLLAGLRDAHMASSPVIAITGGQNDLPRYRHAYQNAEDFTAWDAVTKANYSVDTVERFPDLLRQAFRVATSGTPGPVHLELRGNAGQMLDKEGRLRSRLRGALHAVSGVPARGRARRGQGGDRRAGAGREADHRRRRRRRRVRRGRGDHQARRDAVDPDRDEPARESDRSRRSSAHRRRARQLLALVREPGGGGGRPRVLHRQPHRRAGDERLADPEDRHADDTARHQPATSSAATIRTPSRCTAMRR